MQTQKRKRVVLETTLSDAPAPQLQSSPACASPKPPKRKRASAPASPGLRRDSGSEVWPSFSITGATNPYRVSAACRRQRPRLTASNLARLQSSFMAPKERKSVSPSKGGILDDRRLRSCNISTAITNYKEEELPGDLKFLIRDLLLKDGLKPSPRGQRVVQRAPVAVTRSEADGIDMLKRDLFLDPVFYGGSHDLIDCTNAGNLVRGFLPEQMPADKGVIPPPENPQPDMAFGYVLDKYAQQMKIQSPISAAEEDLVSERKLQVSQAVSFPFLTVQWKSPVNRGTHVQARLQGARDGAAIVNANYILHELAGVEAKPADTCHYSCTCDMQTVLLYIHYRTDAGLDSPVYHMRTLYGAFLEDSEQMDTFKFYMRKIHAWAVGPRLEAIKAGIKRLEKLSRDVRGPATSGSSGEDASSISGDSTWRSVSLAGGQFIPITPSLSDRSQKKRQKTSHPSGPAEQENDG